MRSPSDNKVRQQIEEIRQLPNWFHGFFWKGVPVDALVFSVPSHDGTALDIARQVRHRLAARILSAKVSKWQTYIILAAALLAYIGWTSPLRTSWSNILSFLLAAGALAAMVRYAPVLTRMTFDAAVTEEVDAIIERTFLRDLPPNTPADLKDEMRDGWLTGKGRPLSSEISAEDGRATDARSRSYWWVVVAVAVAMAAGSLVSYKPPSFEGSALSELKPISDPREQAAREGRQVTRQELDDYRRRIQAQQEERQQEVAIQQKKMQKRMEGAQTAQTRALLLHWLFSPYCVFALLVIKLLFDANPLKRRARELEVAEAVEGTAFVAAGGQAWGQLPERARAQQIAEAKRDEDDALPVFTLGQTTGLFAARGDFFGPNANLPMSLSLRDMHNHTLVFGGTGSGKTSGILRPLAHQAAEVENLGLVIMDGKGSLPSELQSLPGMTIIDPRTATLSLVSGIEPAIVADTIRDILDGSGSREGKFFADSAAGALRRGGLLAQAVGGEWWSLYTAATLVSDKAHRAKAIELLGERVESNPLLKDAVSYFNTEWDVMDAETRSNILAHMRSWISTITSTPELLSWAQAAPQDDTVDLFAPLSGGRIGFLIPEHRYGKAGAVVTALLKARLYGGFKARAEVSWRDDKDATPVLFVIDEAQEVATGQDAQMLPVARSLGLATVVATQTVEGVAAALGDATAGKWLSIFANIVALPGPSPTTDRFVVERAGETWQLTPMYVDGGTVRGSLSIEATAGLVATARLQSHMHEFLKKGGSALAGILRPSRIAAMVANARFVGPRSSSSRLTLGPRGFVSAGEVRNLLAVPDTAIAITMRGRVPRRDVVKLNPKYPS